MELRCRSVALIHVRRTSGRAMLGIRTEKKGHSSGERGTDAASAHYLLVTPMNRSEIRRLQAEIEVADGSPSSIGQAALLNLSHGTKPILRRISASSFIPDRGVRNPVDGSFLVCSAGHGLASPDDGSTASVSNILSDTLAVDRDNDRLGWEHATNC